MHKTNPSPIQNEEREVTCIIISTQFWQRMKQNNESRNEKPKKKTNLTKQHAYNRISLRDSNTN